MLIVSEAEYSPEHIFPIFDTFKTFQTTVTFLNLLSIKFLAFVKEHTGKDPSSGL